MKKFLLIATLILSIVSCTNSNDYIISGKVTDFNGQPLDSVTIRLKNKSFENLYETLSDKDGKYSLKVKEGEYFCLYAIKLSDYAVNKLEYWTWNVPVHKDITINPQYERMEIYGINVFEPQVGPFDTYMIYFRPMSLTKALNIEAKNGVKQDGSMKTKKQVEDIYKNEILNVAPEKITPEELKIEINGKTSEVLEIAKIVENPRGNNKMYGYIVQVKKPEGWKDFDSEYDIVSVTLHSKETNEIGKAEAFVKRTK